MTLPRHTIALVYLLVGAHALISFPRVSQHHNRKKPALFAQSNSEKSMSDGQSRRRFVNGISISAIGSFSSGFPCPAQASGAKSRTDGYAVHKSNDEWTSILTPLQFDILRNGGTERSYSSILEGEERLGVYSCAGCGTELFAASEKFHSGTGWPSFASAVEGVEVEKVNSLQANLAGAEVRCATCGGHLGDVFNDGWIFPGTPAFISGKRFCVDGAALVFRPQEGDEVIGDQHPTGGRRM